MELKNTTEGLTTVPLHTIDNSAGTAVEEVMTLTHGHGVDLVVEAIGVPVGWYICQDIVKAGIAPHSAEILQNVNIILKSCFDLIL